MVMRRKKLLKYLPYEYKKSISDIDYLNLKTLGYDTIFFDLDNTIADYETHSPTSVAIDLFKIIKDLGFKIYILTNNTKKRIRKFESELGIKCFESLRKPFTSKLKRRIREHNIETSHVIWIGDQVVTDVRCAYTFNIDSILVDPIKPSTEKWYTKINRFFERRLMKKIKKNYPLEYNKLGLDERYGNN